MTEPLSLKALIEAIDDALRFMTPKEREDAKILFELPWLRPVVSFHSYRGYYDHLALGLDVVDRQDGKPALKAAAYLAWLRTLEGETLYGYKGGEYRVDVDAPVHVSQSSGELSRTVIAGVTADGGNIYLALNRYFN
jgi:hypothetical protein